MSNAYEDVNRSILAYLNGFLSRNSIQDFQVFDFDSHASLQQLPEKDLIGMGDYSIENKKDQYMVTCTIIVCTQADDAYLERLRPVVGKLFNELTPGATGARFPVVDPSGVTRGFLTVADDTMVLPVGNTKTRPLQAIAVSFAVGYQQLPV
jgi:hypothetical protein